MSLNGGSMKVRTLMNIIDRLVNALMVLDALAAIQEMILAFFFKACWGLQALYVQMVRRGK